MVVTPGVAHAVLGWDVNKIQFPVKSHLTDMVHCKSATFFLSNQSLGASSPAELPYPPQASVSEARQLKHRLMESPRVLAARAQNRSLGLSFGIRACMQWVSIISNISVRLLRQQVCWHSCFDLSQRCTFQFFGQQHLELECLLYGNFKSVCCLLLFTVCVWYKGVNVLL